MEKESLERKFDEKTQESRTNMLQLRGKLEMLEHEYNALVEKVGQEKSAAEI